MTRFDTYILKHIARPMGVALVLALIVLLIERMLRLFDLVLGSSGPLGVVFEILAYLVPHYMSMALPISLFLGVLIAFNRLSRDGELEALYSAGAGLARLARPALLAGGVLMILSAIIVGYLQPYARYAYQSMVFAITNTSFHAFLRSGVFVEAEGTTLLIDEIANQTTPKKMILPPSLFWISMCHAPTWVRRRLNCSDSAVRMSGSLR